MDSLERIEDKVDANKVAIAGINSKLDGLCDLIQRTVTHEIEEIKHCSRERGERLGKLEQEVAVNRALTTEKIRQLSSIVLKGGGAVLLAAIVAAVTGRFL